MAKTITSIELEHRLGKVYGRGFVPVAGQKNTWKFMAGEEFAQSELTYITERIMQKAGIKGSIHSEGKRYLEITLEDPVRFMLEVEKKKNYDAIGEAYNKAQRNIDFGLKVDQLKDLFYTLEPADAAFVQLGDTSMEFYIKHDGEITGKEDTDIEELINFLKYVDNHYTQEQSKASFEVIGTSVRMENMSKAAIALMVEFNEALKTPSETGKKIVQGNIAQGLKESMQELGASLNKLQNSVDNWVITERYTSKYYTKDAFEKEVGLNYTPENVERHIKHIFKQETGIEYSTENLQAFIEERSKKFVVYEMPDDAATEKKKHAPKKSKTKSL